jgi:hypothetical protein
MSATKITLDAPAMGRRIEVLHGKRLLRSISSS